MSAFIDEWIFVICVAGVDLYVACEQACALARRRLTPVVFEFNGTLLKAGIITKPEDLARQYNEDRA